jgi:hypothetical protein
MKKLLFFACVFLCASGFASADTGQNQDQQMLCRIKGIVFMMAAENRNVGRSPEEAYQIIGGGYFHKGAPDTGLTKDFVKQAINLVYFDPGFTNAGGMPLAQQIEGYCLRDGKPQFEPLK